MARRGFGGTALRAALGAVTGVAEGLQQREVVAEQRRKDAEEAMFRRITAGILPVEDVLPQEQGKIGPLATSPAAMSSAPTPPATLGQMIAQRTQAPVGGSGPMAPSAFGASAAAPPRTVSNVQRVMDEFSSRAPKTFRQGTQRYALPRTDEERTMLSIALQQAAGQDTTAGNEAAIEKQAQAYASLVGGDMSKARLLARGALPGMLGVETASPLERRVSEANIRQSDAAASASRAGGSQPTQEELAEAAAAFADPSLAPFMQQGLAALLASGDKRPDAVLKLAVYRVLKARANIPTSLGGARESSGFNYLTGGFGSNPAAAGIPGEAPAAAPVATPKPAPAPIADQALEEDRRLYDAGVAKHGSARMLAEYGKRP